MQVTVPSSCRSSCCSSPHATFLERAQIAIFSNPPDHVRYLLGNSPVVITEYAGLPMGVVDNQAVYSSEEISSTTRITIGTRSRPNRLYLRTESSKPCCTWWQYALCLTSQIARSTTSMTRFDRRSWNDKPEGI